MLIWEILCVLTLHAYLNRAYLTGLTVTDFAETA